jgi:uncharacterized membrane protein YfbV (UPF0208 family)
MRKRQCWLHEMQQIKVHATQSGRRIALAVAVFSMAWPYAMGGDFAAAALAQGKGKRVRSQRAVAFVTRNACCTGK